MTAENQLTIHWPNSKEVVARFTRATQDHEKIEDEQFSTRGMLDGLLYDLGHYGRGLSDFPSRLPLSIPVSQKVLDHEHEMKVRTTFSELFSQIAKEVEKYIVEVHRQRKDSDKPRPDAYQNEIDDLRNLI